MKGKILIIGGNGNIGYHCTMESLKIGYEVWTINRNEDTFKHRILPSNVFLHRLYVDVRKLTKQDFDDIGFNENNKFDVIIDFSCYKPEHAHADVELFSKMTNHFIFVSSTSVYKRPVKEIFATETSELDYNTPWGYAYNKIQCEEIFKDAYNKVGFSVTIIRPSYTYDTIIPYGIGYDKGWTVCQRMIDGKKIGVLGDGTSLWSLSHSSDVSKAIVQLFNNQKSINQTFHITSDEYLTWLEISELLAATLNAPPLNIVCIPTNYVLRNKLDLGIHLHYHRRWNDLYDNTKIKSIIPTWKPEVKFINGINKTIEWFNEDVRRKWINDELDNFLDNACTKFSRL